MFFLIWWLIKAIQCEGYKNRNQQEDLAMMERYNDSISMSVTKSFGDTVVTKTVTHRV